jgi:hypothetical protein
MHRLLIFLVPLIGGSPNEDFEVNGEKFPIIQMMERTDRISNEIYVFKSARWQKTTKGDEPELEVQEVLAYLPSWHVRAMKETNKFYHGVVKVRRYRSMGQTTFGFIGPSPRTTYLTLTPPQLERIRKGPWGDD